MTTGRINQVTIPQRTRSLAEMPRELYCMGLLGKEASILVTSSTGETTRTRTALESVGPCHDGNPLYLPRLYTTSP